MAKQKNTFVEDHQDPQKYEIGQRLEFVGYNLEEISVAPVKDGFKSKDILIVQERNGCGMGVDVRRESDGKTDMIWPEEVKVARESE